MSENIGFKIEYLTGVMPFVPPKYWAEQESDRTWTLKCDQGVHLMGFSSRAELVVTARAAGVVLSERPA